MPIVQCPRCSAKNRVDERSVSMQPVCGRCGAKLPGITSASNTSEASEASAAGSVRAVTDATFARQVLEERDRPVLVDCWAPWCGPCRMIAPALEQLAAESAGRYLIAKLNTDENPRTAAQYRINSIPTLLLFKDGQLVDQLVGVQPKQTIAARLAALSH